MAQGQTNIQTTHPSAETDTLTHIPSGEGNEVHPTDVEKRQCLLQSLPTPVCKLMITCCQGVCATDM